MCKKLAFGAVAVALGLVLLSWAGLGSYVTTAVSNIRASAKKQVPLEFEIDRVRNQVDALVPEMHKNIKVVAEEMVAVENLRDDVASTRTNLQKQKDALAQMTKDLNSGVEPISYGGEKYSRQRIADKLARDFASCKTVEAELKAKEQLLDARERSLTAAKEQLASIKAQKQDLEIQIEQLEAELKTVRLAQTKSKFSVDDSKLGECKASLAEIRNRLKAEQKELELEDQFGNTDPIPVDKKTKSAEELTKEVDAYLGGNKDEGKVVQK